MANGSPESGGQAAARGIAPLSSQNTQPAPPSISLPKGGGAIRGMGEKFAANPVTGTGSMSVPLAISPGRSGFGPQLSLSYDSGSGNGPFGFGWSLSLPAITRKTDKGLPQYRDAEESDVYVLSGAEDLVPVLRPDGTRFKDDTTAPGYVIHRYRPRSEGLFARIERWTKIATGEIKWRSITRDNVTTLYGTDNNSRIFDPTDPSPANPTRIFSWHICESYDDKGNAIAYEYAAENDDNADRSQANERNRVRTANRYLKRVRSVNRVSRLTQPDLTQASWMFEVVFDYDEGHYEAVPLNPSRSEGEQHQFVRASASAGRPWGVRPDPFSSHRSGFEVRTYRRCRRVLMFHHIPDLPSGEKGYDGLVRSTEFDYADLDYAQPVQPVTVEDELAHQGSTRFASFLRAVTQSGYVRDDTQAVIVRNGIAYGTYLKKSLPPLEFEYSKANIQDRVLELDAESLENLPVGLDGTTYQWIDLHGEGIPGILTEQADTWFYKRNLSPLPVRDNGSEFVQARLAPVELVAAKPNVALAGGQAQFMDLAGDGQPDLVVLDGPVPGLYEHDDEEGWQPFRPFTARLHRDTRDPNLKFVDLDGDGHADVLITEDAAFVWYPSLAEQGFGPAHRAAQALDEERGPRLVFADGTQSIYLADMCGDGLSDIVRIRNGEVYYWPNLGHGRFGPKVSMDNAPWFDHPEQFDQSRVRLADIKGSGTNDVIYLHREGARLYFNQSGNRLSEARLMAHFPRVDKVSAVMTADLLGNGTACLVWSSPLPGTARRQMRYIDLMGGTKPHLLIKSVNNLGAETEVHYAPSTQFYLADKRDGRPWLSRLPFPVHVVERVVTRDRISGNEFVTRYAYHHGFFDGEEREFRGFGMVEQCDTEEFAALNGAPLATAPTNVEASSHVPPVLTKTWFHTGVHLGRKHISDFFAGLLDANDKGEYYRESGLTDAEARALLLDDTVLADGLTVDEEREACRALKGSVLRQEVYALDRSDKQQHPYIVTEQNFTVRMLQPKAGNDHAVFFTHARESISYHYERNPGDPRVSHALTLEVDQFGNVLKSAAVGYGRREPDLSLSPPDRVKQAQILITYTENQVTNAIDTVDDHRTPLPCESRTYELTGLTPPTGSNRFSLDKILDAGATAIALDYGKAPTAGRLEKRLIEHLRTYYRRNNLAGPLPRAHLQSLALPFESYKLAFTPDLVAEVYGGRATSAMFEEGGYIHSEGDANWWIPSGQIFYSADTADTAAQELAYARQHFFLPHRYRDPFHTNAVSTESFVTFDTYDFLVQETRDALGNRVTVGERNLDAAQSPVRLRQDYRVLQPALIMDPNRNCSEVRFDAFGMVVATAVMGKPEENPRPGDRLTATFRSDLTQAEINQLLANPKEPIAATLLDGATSRIVYDLTAYYREPDLTKKLTAVAARFTRETHASEPVPAGGPRIQASFSYSDGFGREIQKKIQAESGRVPQRDASGKIIVSADGQPVMTLNDVSPRWVGSGWTVFNNKGKPVRQYEPFFTDTHRFEFDVRIGVSPVLFYDSVERLVATLHPNHTWEKVIFDPWRQENWDVNDTALVTDPKTDVDVGDFFSRLANADYLPTWHALRTDAANAAAFAARYPNPIDRANEAQAAEKTRVHAATPSVAHADTLGRIFLAIAHNRFGRNNAVVEENYPTRVELDIEGNQRAARDGVVHNGDVLGRVVMRYHYDMLANRIHQASMEAGERWMLNDVTGKAIRAWDSRGFSRRTTYDELRRPTGLLVTKNGTERLAEHKVFGESQGAAANQRMRVYQVFDAAGVVTNEEYDFKGNLLRSKRELLSAYKSSVDWQQNPAPDDGNFTTRTTYDALDRSLTVTAPDGSVYHPRYNEANLLDKVDVNLRGAVSATPFVTNINYNAKGQRELIAYANGAQTAYEYDPLTFRLSRLRTTRAGDLNGLASKLFTDPGVIQDLHYSYDPLGNITRIADTSLARLSPTVIDNAPSDYTYDAICRLIEARGREHIGQTAHDFNLQNRRDYDFAGLADFMAHPNDLQAMRRYTESYEYDAVGNFKTVRHSADGGAWTRTYAYHEPSLLEAGVKSNRLSRTTVGNGFNHIELYTYDTHGNMTAMPHLPDMQWDFRDQLQHVDLIGGGDAYYVYGPSGQRVRKIVEKNGGALIEERIYLGGFEIFRQRSGTGSVTLARETLHIMDDKQRIALVETKTVDNGNPTAAPEPVQRYQFSNHLGSASLELDHQGQVISYEEYHPYGSTSYQAGRSAAEVSLKRYRCAGMERDEESGLNYHDARYYAPWLGRWMKPDPMGLIDGPNLYRYVRNNPLKLTDSAGTSPDDDNINFSSGGPARRVKLAPHVDEAAAVKGDLAGGVAGSPSDPGNKQFLDPRTNSQSKSNFVSSAPGNARPNVSIANQPLEAAYRILTGRFSEVDELRALANVATARTRPGLRTNSTLRGLMKQDPAIRGALSTVGMNPDTLALENPPGVSQFPTSGPVNLSPVDADLDPASGRVVPGPNTSAALSRRDLRLGGAEEITSGTKGLGTSGSSTGKLGTMTKGVGALSIAIMPLSAGEIAKQWRYGDAPSEELEYADEYGVYTLWVKRNGIFYQNEYTKRYSTGFFAIMHVQVEISKSEYRRLVKLGEAQVGRFNVFGTFEYGTEGPWSGPTN
ncbi:SpvB/TcaC N-terminal domain-containing protein [Bradyrhizobium sp. AZCC 1699]|uniref:SpvB/TcaC N-terminal domain-containing protein n=1 Tax=Bradyrhizobium sp. AZCC 1699 TaxID=3117024 RepID=UPI002FF394B3